MTPKQLLLALLATLSLTLPARAAERPNILFLFSDDQRADTIAALGNPHIQTPHLDRLVREGTAFTRAYCMGAMQGAVCVPSRAMLMSGRTLFRIQENLAGLATWPEQFGAAGYATFISGKWHNGAPSVQRSFQTGKAIFLGGMTQQDVAQAAVQDLSADHQLGAKRPAGKIPSELFADSAIEFLQQQKGERPFVCYVAFNLPHDPKVAPKEYHDRAAASPPPLPKNFLPQHPFNNGELLVRDEKLEQWPRTPEAVRRHLADYYATISFLDAQVGRILAALKESGQYEQTLIVFSSDHGLAIGSHGLFGKQNLYEHSMRAPLLFAGPGVPKAKQSDAFCYLLDIGPTLYELAGVKLPESVEGRSLAPILAGRQAKVRDSLFTAYRHLMRAVRDDQWKLIRYPPINKSQLFDLKADPDELKDLSEDTQHAGELKRLTALLEKWQSDLGDQQPLSTNHPAPLQIELQADAPAKKKKAAK